MHKFKIREKNQQNNMSLDQTTIAICSCQRCLYYNIKKKMVRR